LAVGRTCRSSVAVDRLTEYEWQGHAAGGLLQLIRSCAAERDGAGAQTRDGNAVIKPVCEVTYEEVEATLKATQFRAASQEYFRGGGFSTDYLTKGGMPVTMARLNLVKGLGPVLQLAEGYTVELPEEVHRTLDERTDPTWPTTWFAPVLTGSGSFSSVYDVMNNWGANHGAISYGHIGADLITLASMLRIQVSMHNVEESRILRPLDWSLYGQESLGTADYRAWRDFGAL
ncbi:sugar isomerase, partial [Paenibacillus riograndensis]